MDNVENQYVIQLCTNYCCCIIISSDIGPPTVCTNTDFGKKAILVANILANPIIGILLVKSCNCNFIGYSMSCICLAMVAKVCLLWPKMFNTLEKVSMAMVDKVTRLEVV